MTILDSIISAAQAMTGTKPSPQSADFDAEQNAAPMQSVHKNIGTPNATAERAALQRAIDKFDAENGPSGDHIDFEYKQVPASRMVDIGNGYQKVIL